ncbi:putative splicing factor 3A subunit 2-like [Apostichopus japonicus]|uniref:Putative splicing factor 3A subunit 2-like n=1 Tax=Stichopus japonicus TaxID=307972 RepID=A0A2G8JUL7_STIJA|nr:putative splicing factor 3A subunit 2-like [Apostichopus japonicus]
MDFQHRAGGKTGSGGVASASESNRDRRERLRQLALETIDLNKDPYFMKNHLGSYECKLCLTLHNNEGSYLAHTQGKKHQANLGRRAAKEAKDTPAQPALERARVEIKKFVKIGRPGYKVTKQKDSDSGQQSLLFQVDYPEVAEGINPRHRFMSAYEQRVEPPDKKWQYLLFAAEPYETISFKKMIHALYFFFNTFRIFLRLDSKPRSRQVGGKVLDDLEHRNKAVLPAISLQDGDQTPWTTGPSCDQQDWTSSAPTAEHAQTTPPPVPGMPRPPNIPGGFPHFPPNFGPPGPPMPPRMHLPPPMSLPMPPPPPPTFSTSLPPPSGPPRPPPGVPLPPPGGPPPPVSASGLIPPPPIPPPPPPPSMPTPGAPPSFPLGAPPPPPPPPMPMPLMEADVGSSNETSS